MNPLDFFRTATTPEQQSQQAAQQPKPDHSGPGQVPKEAAANMDGGAVPGSPDSKGATKQADNSPLAEYADLWKNDNKQEGLDLMEQLSLDPAKAAEAVKKAQFSNAISADTLAAISQGGEEAQRAFATAMDTVGQQVFLKAMLAANELSKRGVSTYQQHAEQMLPAQMKQFLVSNQISEQNPMLSNPALAPIVDMVKTGIAAKNPDATPQDQAAMANQFLTAMAQALTPQQQVTGPAGVNANQEQDWSKFLDPTA